MQSTTYGYIRARQQKNRKQIHTYTTEDDDRSDAAVGIPLRTMSLIIMLMIISVRIIIVRKIMIISNTDTVITL